MKTHINLYIEGNLVEMARNKGIKLSDVMTRALETILNLDLPDKELEMQKKEDVIENEIIQLKSVIDNKSRLLSEMKKGKEKKELEREKYAIKRIVFSKD